MKPSIKLKNLKRKLKMDNKGFKDTFERAIVLMAYLANQSAHPVAYNQDANSWVK